MRYRSVRRWARLGWICGALAPLLTLAETQVLDLDEGWNLVSFQVLPENPTPERVFESAPVGAIEALSCYNSSLGMWRSWAPDSPLKGDVSSVTSLRRLQGYWLKVAAPGVQLTVEGAPSTDGALRFEAGWNLIGFPAGEENERGLAQIEAIFRGRVEGPDPDVDVVYAFDENGEALRWDFSIDRREGDFNADGVVNFSDGQFQVDFGVPEDDPNLTEASPTPDDFISVRGGAGYWAHARRAFVLEPRLRTQIASDIDSAPNGNFPGPEDEDFDGDGVLDLGAWTHPNAIGSDTQRTIWVAAGQSTAQIAVSNAGEGILRWDVSVELASALARIAPNAVKVDLSRGQALTDTDSVRISVDRTGLPPGRYNAEIVVNSNGGSRRFSVVVESPEILGDFRGRALIDSVDGKPVVMPDVDLFVSFYETGSGAIRGMIRSDESTHFPISFPLQGSLLAAGASDFVSVASYVMPPNAKLVREPGSLTFSIEEGPSDPELYDVNTINPFPRTVYRELILRGARVRSDVGIEGEFFDTLIGVTSEPIVMEGRFELLRESLEPSEPPMAGSTAPCVIPGTLGQTIPDTGEEKLFTLGELGCDPITRSILIEDVAVYAQFAGVDYSGLRLRLLSPGEDSSDPNAGVLLYHGVEPSAATIVADDLSWPRSFSGARQSLFPQEGLDALRDAYRGARADRDGGGWRLGVTDLKVDGEVGRLTQWALSFDGTEVFEIAGSVAHEGEPLEGVAVTLSGSETLRSAITGSDGVFLFEDLPSHRYRMSLSKPGFKDVRGQDAPIDLNSDTSVGPLPMALSGAVDAKLLISPNRGRIGVDASGAPLPFRGTLAYERAFLIESQTYQFELRRHDLLTGQPVGETLRFPAEPGSDPYVVVELSEAGVYSVRVNVYSGAALGGTIGESEPAALEEYTVVVEDRLPTGASGGQPIVLLGGAFTSGGVIPGDLYPPGSDPNGPPGLFLPVGAGEAPTFDFSYRTEEGGDILSVRLGEDMVRSTTVDINRPSIGASVDGAFDPLTDIWRPNNPNPSGTDMNVAEPIVGNPSNDYGRGPIDGVGWITYDLLPGDNAPGPLAAPVFDGETNRAFVMTVSLGARISGRSVGNGFSLTGGTRFELLNQTEAQE